MPNPSYKKRLDHYPNLRRRSGLDSADEGLGPASRRARMISKALLRAQRRWDAYGLIVSLNQLPWEKSKKTPEWRLIIQNGRLLRGLRNLPINIRERRERLNDAQSGDRKVPMYAMQFRKGDARSERYPGE